MNKLAKMMTRREGFTLVELIVVIAILGILAGIAIPVYSGYINKAKEATDIQQMDAIKTAVIFVVTQDTISSDETANITKMEVSANDIKVPDSTGAMKSIGASALKEVGSLTQLIKGTGDAATFGYGSQWFSITDAFARYLLSQREYIKRHFRWTFIPDEHFVQTVLMQSPFKDRVAQVTTRYIDWKRGKPYIFTAADYELLHSSDCLFARKFDETTDPEIIRMIVNDLQASE